LAAARRATGRHGPLRAAAGPPVGKAGRRSGRSGSMVCRPLGLMLAFAGRGGGGDVVLTPPQRRRPAWPGGSAPHVPDRTTAAAACRRRPQRREGPRRVLWPAGRPARAASGGRQPSQPHARRRVAGSASYND